MNKLKSNFIYDSLYQVIVLIIPFITIPYVARTIGVDGVGIYSYTYSIVNYFMMFALLGMNTYGNREVSKCQDNKNELNKTFTEIYLLQFIITFIVLIIYVLYILLFDPPYLLVSIIQGIYLISVFFDINWLFCGLQEFKVTVTRSIFIKIITFISIFIFVKGQTDLWKYVLILSSTTLLNQIILWPFIKGRVKFTKVNIKDLKKHLKPTAILFIPVIATSIFKVMDKIMLGNFSSVTEVGYYENAEKMLNIILSVVSALGTVTLPQMTYLYSKGNFEEFKKVFYKSISFLFFIILPVIAGFLAVSYDLVFLYLGNSFIKSSYILNILSISLLFSPFASIIRMQILIPQSRDKQYIISVIIGAIVNFVLNIILIRLYNSIGASIATVIAEMLVFVVEYYFIKNEYNIFVEYKNIIRFILSSIIMYFVVLIIGFIIKCTILKLIIQIVFGIFIYFILNLKYILNSIDIKKIFKRKVDY